MKSQPMGRTGLEHPHGSTGNAGSLDSGGSKSGNNGAGFGSPILPKPFDPDLAAVLAAWPDLAPAIRAGVVALVKAGSTGPS